MVRTPTTALKFVNNQSSSMTSKDPLHGKTLEAILTELVDHYGWEDLGNIITINCFNNNPTIKSSLTFLRKTPWARKKVEETYIQMIDQQQ
jgi:uncharacterized protein (DUF2132 family)